MVRQLYGITEICHVNISEFCVSLQETDIFMKVYICQCNLLWCDREGNRAHIEELLSQAGESGWTQGTAEGEKALESRLGG